MDKLLVEHHTFSDGQATSLVNERTKHTHSLRCLFPYLVFVCCFDLLYWLSEKLDRSGLSNASRSLNKDRIGVL